ncbi:MAG: hypothetical protein D6711_17000 [Chloroflexi bacterium]|nr:MAG: hypothetical protein D6711_17000 [Chloroflexota bacterium]
MAELLVCTSTFGSFDLYDIAQVKDDGHEWGAKEKDPVYFTVVHIEGPATDWEYLADRWYKEPDISTVLSVDAALTSDIVRTADRITVKRRRYTINPATKIITDKANGTEFNAT